MPPHTPNTHFPSEDDTGDEADGLLPCNPGTQDTLLTAPDFLEDDERSAIHVVAPAQGNQPVSIFREKHAEQLAFPNIFMGTSRPPTHQPVHYSELCKSEIRRSDRRVAQCVDNIFFKAKKTQMKTLTDKIQIAIRKIRPSSTPYTVGQVRDPAMQTSLLRHDEGYRLLATLRGSPPYFQKANKDLFAMIRTLGPATFFCSFSAAETRWHHLIRILSLIVDDTDLSSHDIDNLSFTEKCRLINSDPATSARHFDYQIQQLIKFIMSEPFVLGKILDFFYRTEFQVLCFPLEILQSCAIPSIYIHPYVRLLVRAAGYL